jgi:hypothetical protein
MMRRLEATLNAKLFYQVLLLLGCLASALGLLDAFLGRTVWLSTQGWWRAAIACWVLVIAVRMVYPPTAK